MKEILTTTINCTTVTDILHDIMNKLPIDLSQEQRNSVELAAEKLYLLQEPNVSIEIEISNIGG